jgi:hypothetical protein
LVQLTRHRGQLEEVRHERARRIISAHAHCWIINQRLLYPDRPDGERFLLGSLAFFSVDVKRGNGLRYPTPLLVVHGISVDVPAPGM